MLQAALCGNPNVGKSTVFNALTGSKQHTGNWSGKTVESASGKMHDGEDLWQLTDLPGIYSLMNGSPEETITSEYLQFHELDAIIVVCDATCMERNLNLGLQIAHFFPQTIFCVNMLDEAEKRGIQLNLSKMQEFLNRPVVGITARKKEGLDELKKALRNCKRAKPDKQHNLLRLPAALQEAVGSISQTIESACPGFTADRSEFSAMRSICTGADFARHLMRLGGNPDVLKERIDAACHKLLCAGYARETVVSTFLAVGYRIADEVCSMVAMQGKNFIHSKQLKLDRLLANRWIGIPIMTLLFAVVLYLSIAGANIPSDWLGNAFRSFEPFLFRCLSAIRLPAWLIEMFVYGIYRVTTWIIAVMLPPMAIFFPLFTILEDAGLLPRIAFNLDHCFQRCCACGKQALCMCMGLGCNSVGVTGCRIIQSPRERLIAILTNSFVPCNGRLPAIFVLISMLFASYGNLQTTLAVMLVLLLLIAASILMTFACSWLLSRTVLKGIPSASVLEIPPFRVPKLGDVIVSSIWNRTLFVLARAAWVAVPAGAFIWLMGNVSIHNQSFLSLAAEWLNPVGRFFGMDGVIMLAFLFSFPANEIALPIVIMAYLGQGTLQEVPGLSTLGAVLAANGWTVTTIVCTLVFSLFHWPCATTMHTIYQETRSVKWTALAFLLPTAAGLILCFILSRVINFF